MAKTYADEQLKPRCRLAEITQYVCTPDYVERRIVCSEVPRIFRLCEGRPAIELTAFTSYDPKTGEITLPDLTSSNLPQGKKWRDLPHRDS